MHSPKHCRYCGRLFYPDRRVGDRQESCSREVCRKRRKAESQKRWVEANPDCFQGRYENTRVWLRDRPGYLRGWRARRRDIQDEIRLCNPPAKGNEKGRVERLIRSIRETFLNTADHHQSLAALNEALHRSGNRLSDKAKRERIYAVIKDMDPVVAAFLEQNAQAGEDPYQSAYVFFKSGLQDTGRPHPGGSPGPAASAILDRLSYQGTFVTLEEGKSHRPERKRN